MPAEETNTNKEETTTVKGAVAAAVASLDSEGDKGEKKPAESSKEEKTESTKEEKKVDQERIDAALKLYEALEKPETRDLMIAAIAQQGGYTKQGAPETKEEIKEAKKDLLSRLKEKLGPEFNFIAESISGPIEEFLKEQREEGLKEIKDKLALDEQEKLQAQSASAITKLTSGFFGEGSDLPDNVQTEMSKFMDKVPATADLSIKEYVELAFNFAVGKLGLTKVDKTKQTRTSNNRTDAASRLASDRSSSATGRAVPDTSKPQTIRQSVLAAIDAINSKDK